MVIVVIVNMYAEFRVIFVVCVNYANFDRFKLQITTILPLLYKFRANFVHF